MSILTSWQLQGMRSRVAAWDSSIDDTQWDELFQWEYRRLARVSIAGIVMAVVCAWGYWTTLEPSIRTHLTGHAGLPWLITLIAGSSLQIAGWFIQLRRTCFCSHWRIALTAALLITLLAGASLREIIRLSQANLDQVAASTKAAAQVGGLGLFLLFTVVNTGLIAWCIQMVRSNARVAKTVE